MSSSDASFSARCRDGEEVHGSVFLSASGSLERGVIFLAMQRALWTIGYNIMSSEGDVSCSIVNHCLMSAS